MQKSKIALLSIAGCATMAAFSACKNTSDSSETKSTDVTATNTEVVKHISVADDSLFVKDESGLDCKWVTHGTGTVTPKVGDMVEVSFASILGDSMMVNTETQNNHMPVQQQITEPAAKGDLMIGLMKMKAGDSAVFRMRADTFFSRMHQPLVAWVKPNDYIVWAVKLTKVIDKAQIAEESKKKFAETLAQIAKDNKAQNDIDDKKIQAYLKAHNIKGAKKTADGIYYTISKQGSGAHPQLGQKAIVNYTGHNLKDERFDSNVDPAFQHVGPFDFTVGGNVILGWSLAVPLMNKGTKATFYIPSSLSYGAQAKDAKIGANEVLAFDIELVDFK